MKILLVEDDKHSRLFLAETIKSQGHQIAIAQNGEEGLAKFLEFGPDLVLSDVHMPKMDGLQLLSEIRKHNEDVIVIMSTASGSEEYAIEALRRKANNYLPKPFRFGDLVSMLRRYDTLLKDRTIHHEILGMIIRREFTIQFDNRIALVTKIVDRLMHETGDFIPGDQRLGVHLGLVELLTNAIEHGNLGIASENKHSILENDGFEGLMQEYEKRLLDPQYASKKVTIDFKMNPTSCEWTIADEGKGFDWQTLPDPTQDNNLLRFHGRGIFLSRMQFEEFEFLGCGNTIRVKKNKLPL